MIILLEHKLKEIKKFSPLSPPFLAAARNVVLYVSTFKALEQFHLAKNFSIFFLSSLPFAFPLDCKNVGGWRRKAHKKNLHKKSWSFSLIARLYWKCFHVSFILLLLLLTSPLSPGMVIKIEFPSANLPNNESDFAIREAQFPLLVGIKIPPKAIHKPRFPLSKSPVGVERRQFYFLAMIMLGSLNSHDTHMRHNIM